MTRISKINFERITFSFPKRVVVKLREKIDKNNMSKYVADLIEEDLIKNQVDDIDKFFEEMDEFSEKLTKLKKTKKSTLQIIREIRRGKKYT